MNWKIDSKNQLPIQKTFDDFFRRAQLSSPEMFPNIRNDTCVVMACDYSGDHQDSRFQILTFFLADKRSVVEKWDPTRTSIRTEMLKDNRRHAFKSLLDARRREALVPFLKACSSLNGIVLSVAIEKQLIDTDFGVVLPISPNLKPKVQRKATRIGLFGGILLSGLASASQSVTWITDEDEIVANDTIADATTEIAGGALRACCPGGFKEITFGISGKFDDERRAEDLCSIPDLIGGAVCELLNAMNESSIPTFGQSPSLPDHQMSEKSQLILNWLTLTSGSLKFCTCLIRSSESTPGSLVFSFGNPAPMWEGYPGSQLTIPFSEKWARQLRKLFLPR